VIKSQLELQNSILLTPSPVIDFMNLLLEGMRNVIREEIKAEREADAVNLHISEKAAREMFYPPASKSTFYRWSKSGLINKKRIGNRVVYSKSEIEAAVKTIKLYRQKAG
jgi:hypothetical protein